MPRSSNLWMLQIFQQGRGQLQHLRWSGGGDRQPKEMQRPHPAMLGEAGGPPLSNPRFALKATCSGP